MYNGQKIADLIASSKATKTSICDAVGFTSNSQLRQVIQGNPTAKTLEKIADFFNVSIDYFFDRQNSFESKDTCTISEPKESHEYIKPVNYDRDAISALLAEKDRHIASLENIINLLSEDIKARRSRE